MTNLILNTIYLIGAVCLGGMLVQLLEKKSQKRFIKLSLAFSGGFLLAIAFTHFLPELYRTNELQTGIWILVGFLVQLFLEYFSGGIEHGHIHVHKDHKIPYMMLLSLSIHSFIEGIPLASTDTHTHIHNHVVGDHHSSLLIGIILHQFPVAIALMTLLIKSKISLRKAWFWLLVFGAMTPLGMYSGLVIDQHSAAHSMEILLSVVVGMFLHISTTIIFETNEDHRFNLSKLVAILLGVGLSFGLM